MNNKTPTVQGSGRQAITTKYHGPTNHRGARVSARCQGGRVSVPWDHALNASENHEAAALALVRKLRWGGWWRGGALPTGSGYCFVDTSTD